LDVIWQFGSHDVATTNTFVSNKFLKIGLA